jgi:hypothetical protein
MKNSFVTSFGILCLAVFPALAAENRVLFEDNFESGNLHQWTGDVHGPHHGVIVADPLRHENHVLTFTELSANGDLFCAALVSVANSAQRYVLSFDYLGLPQADSVPDNLGGFLGLATSVDEWQQGRYWLAGTDASGINTPIGVELKDDGAWHHYEIDVTSLVRSAGLTDVHIMVEDWRDIGGVPGDVFFDNIRLVATRVHEPKVQLHVTEVTLCWDSETNDIYQLQYRSSHSPGGWMNVGLPVAGNGGTNCVVDHLAIGEPQRFYRVIVLP